MISMFANGRTGSIRGMRNKPIWLESVENEQSPGTIPSVTRKRKGQAPILNPIDNINPPHFALPSSIFWNFVFPCLDQRAFLALASTCHDWYKLFWEEDLWARIGCVSFTDKGMRRSSSRTRIRFYWHKLLFKLGLGDEIIEARTLKLLDHERFSMVTSAKITSFLGTSQHDSVPSCLLALLIRMPRLESLYIGGRGGSRLRWSQYKVFPELVKLAPNIKELLIPSYPPKGVRTVVRRHPSCHTLHLQNLIGPCVYGEWILPFQGRDIRNSRLRCLTLINQGPVSWSHLKWVLTCCPNLHTLCLRGLTYLRDVPTDWRDLMSHLAAPTKTQWARNVIIDVGKESDTTLYTFDVLSGTVTPSQWTADYTMYEGSFNGLTATAFGPIV